MSWHDTAVDLATQFPSALLGSGENPGDMPRISIPFDRQVPKLLTRLEGGKLDYNPHRIDDLIPALGARLGECYHARERAHQLQQDGFREVSDIVQRRTFFEQSRVQLAWSRANESGFLRNQTSLRVEPGAVQVPTMTKEEKKVVDENWSALYDSQFAQLEALEKENERRVLRLEEAVGAGNYAHRFEQLFRLFAVDVVEAYQMALAVKVGMHVVYRTELEALPDVESFTFLDDLIAWFKTCQTVYRLALEGARYVTVVLPFVKNDEGFVMTGPDDFSKQLGNQTLSFDLRKGKVKEYLLLNHGVSDHARLRAIDFWSQATSPADLSGPLALRKAIQCRVEPPEQSTLIAPFNGNQSFTGVPIRDIAHIDNDIFVPHHLVNCAPIGLWRLVIEPTTITGDAVNTDMLKNLFARIKFLIPAEIEPAAMALRATGQDL